MEDFCDELDNYMNNWLVNVPYLLVVNLSNETASNPLEVCQTSRRYYFMHENTFVFTLKGEKIELYTMLNSLSQPDIYLSSPLDKGWCINYFMVLNPYSLAKENINLNIRMNGKRVPQEALQQHNSIYEALWCLTLDSTFCSSRFSQHSEKELTITIPTKCRKIQKRLERYKACEEAKKFAKTIDIQRMKIRNQKSPLFPPLKIRQFYPALTSTFPKRPYIEGKLPVPDNTHWGQVKLLLSEIEFLMKIQKPFKCGTIVVYAGAAQGFHIPYLSRLFPFILFILYDPAKFAISPSQNIIIRREFFTDEISLLYKGYNVMFISDIRLGGTGHKEFEENVEKNNEMQAKWALNMDPWNSLLKFRFPFVKGQTLYFDGIVNFQAFAPPVSAETRLVPFQGLTATKEYNHEDYENQMFYFNTEYRNRSFIDFDPVFGVNYDTYRMYTILKNYLQWAGICGENEKEIYLSVFAMIYEIERLLRGDKISRLLRPVHRAGKRAFPKKKRYLRKEK